MAQEALEPDRELATIQAVSLLLKNLEDDEARDRVLGYVLGRFGRRTAAMSASPRQQARVATDAHPPGHGEPVTERFATMAKLFEEAKPISTVKRLLVAGYWLQVCEEAGSFDSFSVNRELKRLGEGSTNIAVAIDAVKRHKPVLLLQINKSGTSRQARTAYKLTVAGIRIVERMIASRSS